MAQELRCKIKIRLPVDGKKPRDVAAVMVKIEAAMQALDQALDKMTFNK